MNILHFSTKDIEGGAAKAAYRLHTALCGHGCNSRMLVKSKLSENDNIDEIAALPVSFFTRGMNRVRNKIPFFKDPQVKYMYNLDADQDLDLSTHLSVYKNGEVDIVCLHWITEFLTVDDILCIYNKFKCPILWVLMDQEPLTGGCHYSFGCEGYMSQCGNCPQLVPSHEGDNSRCTWEKKNKNLSGIPITLISPSVWTTERIKRSSLFRKRHYECIPISIDTSVFRPFDKLAARDLLHLPPHKKIVFFGAFSLADPRKGMEYLLQSLKELSSRPMAMDVHLLVAGNDGKNMLANLPLEFTSMSYLRDDITLALAYQASDVFVCPSVEDAGPMMIAESMLCGTPVVAFDAGGAPDLVETGKTGYLAKYKDSVDLAYGIQFVLSSGHSSMGEVAYERAKERHAPENVVSRYLLLCESLIKGS